MTDQHDDAQLDLAATAARSSWSASPRMHLEDGLLWLGVCIPALMALDGAAPGFADLAAVFTALVLIVTRRRRPFSSLAVCIVALVATTAGAGRPTALMATTIVLLFAVSVRRERRVALAAAALGVIGLVGTVLVLHAQDFFGPEILAAFAWATLAVAAGDAARSRREAIAAADERARRAEASREEEAQRRVVEERLHIARGLHDVIAHHITVINVQASVAAHLIETDRAAAGAALTEVRVAARGVIDELAGILGVLRGADDAPAATAPMPTLRQLPELVDSFERAGLAVTLRTTGQERPLLDTTSIAAYRIAQEALTNAHKHGCGTAELHVSHRPDHLEIAVVNRRGPENRSDTAGFGLIGMRERVSAAGGRLSTGPTGVGDFTVHAVLPRHRAAGPT